MNDGPLDVVTVIHNERNAAQAAEMETALASYADVAYAFWLVDNRPPGPNRGFGSACNLGSTWGSAPIILFLNPDLVIRGPFLGLICDAISNDSTVIVGERFEKSQWELDIWGCRDWVCGAAMAVKRDWWESVGGFDPRFVWGWEETDLVRRAQQQARVVRSICLPLDHRSPDVDSPADVAYKHEHFEAGARIFQQQWGGR